MSHRDDASTALTALDDVSTYGDEDLPSTPHDTPTNPLSTPGGVRLSLQHRAPPLQLASLVTRSSSLSADNKLSSIITPKDSRPESVSDSVLGDSASTLVMGRSSSFLNKDQQRHRSKRGGRSPSGRVDGGLDQSESFTTFEKPPLIVPPESSSKGSPTSTIITVHREESSPKGLLRSRLSDVTAEKGRRASRSPVVGDSRGKGGLFDPSTATYATDFEEGMLGAYFGVSGDFAKLRQLPQLIDGIIRKVSLEKTAEVGGGHTARLRPIHLCVVEAAQIVENTLKNPGFLSLIKDKGIKVGINDVVAKWDTACSVLYAFFGGVHVAEALRDVVAQREGLVAGFRDVISQICCAQCVVPGWKRIVEGVTTRLPEEEMPVASGPAPPKHDIPFLVNVLLLRTSCILHVATALCTLLGDILYQKNSPGIAFAISAALCCITIGITIAYSAAPNSIFAVNVGLLSVSSHTMLIREPVVPVDCFLCLWLASVVLQQNGAIRGIFLACRIGFTVLWLVLRSVDSDSPGPCGVTLGVLPVVVLFGVSEVARRALQDDLWTISQAVRYGAYYRAICVGAGGGPSEVDETRLLLLQKEMATMSASLSSAFVKEKPDNAETQTPQLREVVSCVQRSLERMGDIIEKNDENAASVMSTSSRHRRESGVIPVSVWSETDDKDSAGDNVNHVPHVHHVSRINSIPQVKTKGPVGNGVSHGLESELVFQIKQDGGEVHHYSVHAAQLLSSNLFIALDADMTVAYWGARVGDCTSISQEQIVGRSLLTFLHTEQEQSTLEAAVAEALSGSIGEPKLYTVRADYHDTTLLIAFQPCQLLGSEGRGKQVIIGTGTALGVEHCLAQYTQWLFEVVRVPLNDIMSAVHALSEQQHREASDLLATNTAPSPLALAPAPFDSDDDDDAPNPCMVTLGSSLLADSNHPSQNVRKAAPITSETNNVTSAAMEAWVEQVSLLTEAATDILEKFEPLCTNLVQIPFSVWNPVRLNELLEKVSVSAQQRDLINELGEIEDDVQFPVLYQSEEVTSSHFFLDRRRVEGCLMGLLRFTMATTSQENLSERLATLPGSSSKFEFKRGASLRAYELSTGGVTSLIFSVKAKDSDGDMCSSSPASRPENSKRDARKKERSGSTAHVDTSVFDVRSAQGSEMAQIKLTILQMGGNVTYRNSNEFQVELPSIPAVGGSDLVAIKEQQISKHSFTSLIYENSWLERRPILQAIWRRGHAATVLHDGQGLPSTCFDVFILDHHGPDTMHLLVEISSRKNPVQVVVTHSKMMKDGERQMYASKKVRLIEKPLRMQELNQVLADAEKMITDLKRLRETQESLRKTFGKGGCPWTRTKKLGKGAFSEVFKATNLRTRGIMAVKILQMQEKRDEEIMNIVNEIQLLSDHRHDNIIHYFYCERNDEKQELHIFMEYSAGGTLYQFVRDFNHLDSNTASCCLFDVLSALQYLHSQNVIHRDIKSQNVCIFLDRIVHQRGALGLPQNFMTLLSQYQLSQRSHIVFI